MADLVKAIGDFIAALLSVVGFVGRPRQRSHIREDLALLRELEAHEHITIQIARFSGLDLRTSRRSISWSSVVLATVIWAPLWTLCLKGFQVCEYRGSWG